MVIVLINVVDTGTRYAFLVRRIMYVDMETMLFGIIAVEPSARSYPDGALGINGQAVDPVTFERVFFKGSDTECVFVQTIKPLLGSYPQVVFTILHNALYVVIAQKVRVVHV